jgi:hypothetical protein
MSLSKFEVNVLGWVLNDYEAVHTIRGDIARDLGRPVSEEEVGAALLTLARMSLVDVFFFDVALSQYRPAGPDEFPVAQLWFLGNEKGIAEEERLA